MENEHTSLIVLDHERRGEKLFLNGNSALIQRFPAKTCNGLKLYTWEFEM